MNLDEKIDFIFGCCDIARITKNPQQNYDCKIGEYLKGVCRLDLGYELGWFNLYEIIYRVKGAKYTEKTYGETLDQAASIAYDQIKQCLIDAQEDD